jgi:hypothetical protein
MTQDGMTQQEIMQPPSLLRNGNYEAMEEDNDAYECDESEGDPNDNEVGDLDVFVRKRTWTMTYLITDATQQNWRMKVPRRR